MMILHFQTILVAVLALAQTEPRIPVTCSVSESMGSILEGKDVTSIRCDSRDGFFVPRLRYRELREIEILSETGIEEKKLLEEQVSELSLAVESLVATSSAAEEEIDAYKNLYDLQTRALYESERRAVRSWYEHPGVWIGVGIIATIAATISIANILPDRVISSQ